MDSTTIEKMFEPYYTKERAKGTGLGLTVVSDALSEIGGTISVRSAKSQGTIVEMLFPDATFGSVNEKN
jgi:nitrogen fixation/metabolism regulation signal transduction histidine kinase